MATTSWLAGNNGLWTDGAYWSGGAEPGAADNVLIAAAPAVERLPYTVSLDASDQVSGLELDQAQAILAVQDATLSVGDSLGLTAGTLQLDSGTLTGTGAQSSAFGSLGSISLVGYSFEQPFNEIADLAWQGALSLSDGNADGPSTASVLLDDVTFSNHASLLLGPDVLADIEGTTLDDVDVSLGPSSALVGSADGNLAIGSQAVVFADTSSSIGGADVTNAGSIFTGAQGVSIDAQNDFTNSGTLDVDVGGNMVVEAEAGSNSGDILVHYGYLKLETAGGFTNTGQITVEGGTLSLGFALTTAQLAAYAVKGGTAGISGVLDNAGATLASGVQAKHVLLDGGTVVGGTITAAGFGFDKGAAYAAETGTLSGVTFDGVLDLAGSDLTIADGIVLGGPGRAPGRVQLSGGSTLTFATSQTLTHTNITLTGDGTFDNITGVVAGTSQEASGTTLTLGTGCLVTQVGQVASLGAATRQDAVVNEGLIDATSAGGTLEAGGLVNAGRIDLAGETLSGIAANAGLITTTGNAEVTSSDGGTVLNAGIINAKGAGNTLTVAGALTNTGSILVSDGASLALDLGALTNPGRISVTDGVLDVGTLTIAQLLQVHLSGSSVDVTGVLDIGAGGDLRVGGARSPVQNLSVSGTLSGGNVLVDASTSVQFGGNVGLDGVNFDGVVAATRPFTTFTVTGDTVFDTGGDTQDGIVRLNGAASALVWDSTQAFDNATLALGSQSLSYEGQALAAASLLTSDETGPLVLGAKLAIQQTGLYADIGGTGGAAGTASGTIASDAVIQAGVAGGALTLDGASFTNGGTLAISGGETVTADATALVNAAGGTISIGQGSTLALNLYNTYANAPGAAASFTNDGTVVLAGGTLGEPTDGGALPALPLLNDNTIEGYGTLSAPVEHGIVLASGGTLAVTGAVGGAPELSVGSGAALVLGSVAAGATASFKGASGVLALSPPAFLGEVGTFVPGDTIDLLGTVASAASFGGHAIDITLTAGGTLAIATVSALTGSLTVGSDGHGGTDISFASASASAEPHPSATPFWAELHGHPLF